MPPGRKRKTRTLPATSISTHKTPLLATPPAPTPRHNTRQNPTPTPTPAIPSDTTEWDPSMVSPATIASFSFCQPRSSPLKTNTLAPAAAPPPETGTFLTTLHPIPLKLQRGAKSGGKEAPLGRDIPGRRMTRSSTGGDVGEGVGEGSLKEKKLERNRALRGRRERREREGEEMDRVLAEALKMDVDVPMIVEGVGDAELQVPGGQALEEAESGEGSQHLKQPERVVSAPLVSIQTVPLQLPVNNEKKIGCKFVDYKAPTHHVPAPLEYHGPILMPVKNTPPPKKSPVPSVLPPKRLPAQAPNRINLTKVDLLVNEQVPKQSPSASEAPKQLERMRVQTTTQQAPKLPVAVPTANEIAPKQASKHFERQPVTAPTANEQAPKQALKNLGCAVLEAPTNLQRLNGQAPEQLGRMPVSNSPHSEYMPIPQAPKYIPTEPPAPPPPKQPEHLPPPMNVPFYQHYQIVTPEPRSMAPQYLQRGFTVPVQQAGHLAAAQSAQNNMDRIDAAIQSVPVHWAVSNGQASNGKTANEQAQMQAQRYWERMPGSVLASNGNGQAQMQALGQLERMPVGILAVNGQAANGRAQMQAPRHLERMPVTNGQAPEYLERGLVVGNGQAPKHLERMPAARSIANELAQKNLARMTAANDQIQQNIDRIAGGLPPAPKYLERGLVIGNGQASRQLERMPAVNQKNTAAANPQVRHTSQTPRPRITARPQVIVHRPPGTPTTSDIPSSNPNTPSPRKDPTNPNFGTTRPGEESPDYNPDPTWAFLQSRNPPTLFPPSDLFPAEPPSSPSPEPSQQYPSGSTPTSYSQRQGSPTSLINMYRVHAASGNVRRGMSLLHTKRAYVGEKELLDMDMPVEGGVMQMGEMGEMLEEMEQGERGAEVRLDSVDWERREMERREKGGWKRVRMG